MNDSNNNIPTKTQVTLKFDALTDPALTRPRDFPVPDHQGKGTDNGPEDFAGNSDKQLAPRLNASNGYGPTVKSKEGKAFPFSGNSKASKDESQTFAGARADVSINLQSGQILSNAGDIKKNRI